MLTNDDGDLRATWQNQLTTKMAMDPEKIRERAKQLQSKARRDVFFNQICSGLLALMAGVSMFVLRDRGVLFIAAMAMVLATSVYMAWAFKYFFAAVPIAVDADAEACAAAHKRQLQRQRDMNRSARSAGPLVLPAIALIALSRHWPNAHTYVGPQEWGMTIALVGSAYFLMQLIFTYTDLIAHRFQREIDELDAMI